MQPQLILLLRNGTTHSLVGEMDKMEVIRSHVERHDRPSGGSRGSRSKTRYGPQDVLAQDKGERRFAGHLSGYYDTVVSCIRGADAILIFGPGEAMRELKKRLVRGEG